MNDLNFYTILKPKEKNSIKNLDGFYCEEKEFVIDIDMTDYDPVRTCC